MAQNFFSPTQIANVHALASSTSLTFPTQTLSSDDAVTYLKQSSWDITKNGAWQFPWKEVGGTITQLLCRLVCDQAI